MVYFDLLVCCSLGWVLRKGVLQFAQCAGCPQCAVCSVPVVQCAVCSAQCAGCPPHKWNTYGNLPQWSEGEGKGEHQISVVKWFSSSQDIVIGATNLVKSNYPLLA